MRRMVLPETVIGHSVVFWHEEPGLTVVRDDSNLELSDFERFLPMGFLYTPISVLQACDKYGESWRWAIASDDSSLDIVWLLEALSRFEDGWTVTPDNWVISPVRSKIDLAQMTSIVSEAKRPPNPIEPVKQKLMAPLVATALMSFTLGVLFSLFF